ncbi:MAG TPA: hypothetical protein VJQ52_16670 [Steroidobacteraceae bacterium]|nr:hypothetical protein [Steroidobacteraceae bacterium]
MAFDETVSDISLESGAWLKFNESLLVKLQHNLSAFSLRRLAVSSLIQVCARQG